MILEATAYLDNGFRSHGVGREPTGVVAEFLEPHIQDQESQAYLLCSWSRRHPPKLPDSVAADDASPGDRRSARRRPAVETMEIVFPDLLFKLRPSASALCLVGARMETAVTSCG